MKRPGRWGGVAAVVVLVVYAVSLAPGLVGGDAGELTLAAFHLEVAHPPGYPLWTLLAPPFTVLADEPAQGASLFSALAEAGAVGLLAALVIELTGSAGAALFTALLFGLSPLVVPYATSREVFALHHALVAGLLCAAWP